MMFYVIEIVNMVNIVIVCWKSNRKIIGPNPFFDISVMRCENEVSQCYQLFEFKSYTYVTNFSFQILRNDIKAVVRLMLEELKNLRSQVCRSAALVK